MDEAKGDIEREEQLRSEAEVLQRVESFIERGWF